jgi:hypothetical protein
MHSKISERGLPIQSNIGKYIEVSISHTADLYTERYINAVI